jgi:hypothetical protein
MPFLEYGLGVQPVGLHGRTEAREYGGDGAVRSKLEKAGVVEVCAGPPNCLYM